MLLKGTNKQAETLKQMLVAATDIEYYTAATVENQDDEHQQQQQQPAEKLTIGCVLQILKQLLSSGKFTAASPLHVGACLYFVSRSSWEK